MSYKEKVKDVLKWILPYNIVIRYQNRTIRRWSQSLKGFLSSGFYKETEEQFDHQKFNYQNEFPELQDSINKFFDQGQSLANQMNLISYISQEKIDFIVIDGSHEGEYVKRELTASYKLLKVGG